MKTVVHWICCWIVVALLAWRCVPAAAIFVTPPPANGNSSAPADDPGWLNVGDRGVYLGNRWVLTANHVEPDTTHFQDVAGSPFLYETGTRVQLLNPDTSGADLIMYRLTTDPGLPSLAIATTTPAVNAKVTLIGDGGAPHPTNAESNKVFYWNVTQILPDPDDDPTPNYDWGNPVESTDPHNTSGYIADIERKMWGTNLVERDSDFFDDEEDPDHTLIVDDGYGLTISFITEFDKEGETEGDVTEHEAQALGHDSGGGVFAKEGDHWVLAGLIYAIGSFIDQPNTGGSAVYGNITYIADLSQYRSQILSIMGVPEPSGFWLVGGVGALVGLARLAFRRDRAC